MRFIVGCRMWQVDACCQMPCELGVEDFASLELGVVGQGAATF